MDRAARSLFKSGTVCAARMPQLTLYHCVCAVCCALQLSVSLSRVSPSLLHLLAATCTLQRYLKPACATLAASLSMAHCLVQLNSYSNSALSLAHHSSFSMSFSSRPPASIAARIRHESRSQACGSREVNARTQQSANSCRVSGWAVTSFKSASSILTCQASLSQLT